MHEPVKENHHIIPVKEIILEQDIMIPTGTRMKSSFISETDLHILKGDSIVVFRTGYISITHHNDIIDPQYRHKPYAVKYLEFSKEILKVALKAKHTLVDLLPDTDNQSSLRVV